MIDSTTFTYFSLLNPGRGRKVKVVQKMRKIKRRNNNKLDLNSDYALGSLTQFKCRVVEFWSVLTRLRHHFEL